MTTAYDLKLKGNELYKQGDYSGAEEFYSQAIQKDPNQASLFSNRALVRMKLQSWTGVEHDARIAADLFGPKHASGIKSNYYLAEALLGLQRPSEAYDVALAAYQVSLDTRSPNSEVLSKIILRAKQAIWATKETARLREMNETLRSVEESLLSERDAELERLSRQKQNGEIGFTGYNEDVKVVREECERKIANVREIFSKSMGGDMKERIVPDYLIDSISFEIMHDPVVTPSGHSFERVGILKHLQHSPVDPMTRVPMTAEDLRPNYALKAACADFLEKNGWAVDW